MYLYHFIMTSTLLFIPKIKMHPDQYVIDIHLSYLYKFTAKVKKKINSCKKNGIFYHFTTFLTSLFERNRNTAQKK